MIYANEYTDQTMDMYLTRIQGFMFPLGADTRQLNAFWSPISLSPLVDCTVDKGA